MTHRLFIVSLAAAAVLLSATVSLGQSIREVDKIHFDDILTGRNGERRVELYLRAVTRYEEPVDGLTGADFKINDAGARIDSAEVEVATLSATGVGMTCVIAIDVSRTMRGDPFDRARGAALDFVKLLDPSDRVAIVTFSDEVRVPVNFSASRSEAIAQLETLQINDRSLTTVLYDGLHKSIEMIRLGRNLPRRAFVVIFSDGKDSGSLRNIGQVTEFGRSNLIQPPVLIFSIGYSRFGGDGLPILQKLSKDTGGDYVRAESPLQITTFFNSTRRQMRDSLVVSYVGDLDGKEHQVEVAVESVVASRTANYANIRPPILPWAIAGGVFLIVLIVGVLVARGRSGGRLLFVNGSLAGQAIALQGSRTRVGALPDNQIVLVSDSVSRYHAALFGRGRKVRIQDLDSSNGTFLNENRISSSPLKSGDKIRFADVEAIFER